MSDEIKKEEETAVVVDPNKNEKKVKFDEDQTKVVNTLYNDAFKAGAEKVEAERKKLEATHAALAAEKAALEAELLKVKATPIPKKEETTPPQQTEAMERILAQMTEMKGIVDSIKTERDQLKTQVDTQAKEQRKAKKKDLFLDAVTKAKINFFDPLEAYKLAEDDGYEFDAESDKPVIKNKATGTFKLNENAEPMSVVDFVKDFARRKNYLVQATSAGGTGGGESRKSETSGPKEKSIADMTNEEFEAFRSKVLTTATPTRR